MIEFPHLFEAIFFGTWLGLLFVCVVWLAHTDGGEIDQGDDDAEQDS